MEREPQHPQHLIDMSKPGMWSRFNSWLLFVVAILCIIESWQQMNESEPVVGGLLLISGMLALIGSILLYDRFKRETAT